MTTLRRHGAAVAGIALLAVVAWGRAVLLKPLQVDNLGTLSFVQRGNPLDFFSRNVGWAKLIDTWSPLPAYRPIAYLTVWLQTETTGLRSVPLFAVNVACLAATGIALYALVFRLTGSRLAALLAGGLVVRDARNYWSLVWIIERQSALAVLLGLAALALAVGTRPGRWRPAVVFVLLLGSVLSKEYGFAFAGALPLLVGEGRRRTALVVSAAVAAVYAILRFPIAHIGGGYCETFGYFQHTRDFCYSDLSTTAQLTQHAYNVGATLVGTVYPILFTQVGQLQTPSLASLAVPTLVAGLAVLGAVTRPRAALPLLALVVGNALLSFMLYRTRNELVGIAGLYGAAGVGAAILIARASALPRQTRLRATALVVAGAAAVFLVGVRADIRLIHDERIRGAVIDPCKEYRRAPHILDRTVVNELLARAGRAERCTMPR